MAPSAVRLPAPKAHPLFGHAHQLHADPLTFLTATARTYGGVVPLRLGPLRVLFLSDPAAIDEVLVRRSRSFRKGLSLQRVRMVLGRGLLTNEGEDWLRQRRLIQPLFHHERVALYGRVMVDTTRRLLDQWQDGQQRDLHDDIMQLTLSIVTECLLGAQAAGTAAAFAAAVSDAQAAAYTRLNSILVLLPDGVPNPQVTRLRRMARALHQLLSEIVATRRGHQGDSLDLLSLLLQARDAKDGRGMPERQVIDEIMTLVLAGHETTAILLTWTWYLLAQHPAVEAALAQELEQALGGRLPTVADLPRLSLARAILQEALRLYPPSWIIERQAIEPVEVAGQQLKKGDAVLISQWVMHRDPRFFDQPEAFRPERWQDNLEQRLPRFAYFPFGGGPRMCIGAAFAMQEGLLLLATIQQRYRVSLAQPGPLEPWPTVTLRPRSGLLVHVHRRPAAPPLGTAPTLADPPPQP